MLEAVSATGGVRVRADDVPLVTALLLVSDGVSPTELAERFAAMCPAENASAGAAALLSRLAELGLVRLTRQDAEKHYVLTVLGQRHSEATLAGQPDRKSTRLNSSQLPL